MAEVQDLCNLSRDVEMEGVEKTMLENIRNLMETMTWTAQQAMEALKIPKMDQEKYKSRLS